MPVKYTFDYFDMVKIDIGLHIKNDKFDELRSFLIKKGINYPGSELIATVNSSNGSKIAEPAPMPLYLQQRYGTKYFVKTNVKTTHHSHSHTHAHSNSGAHSQRKKLYVETGHILESLKAILLKLSGGNKLKMFESIKELDIDPSQYQCISQCLYEHSVDLQHMNDIYVEMFQYLYQDNPALMDMVVNLAIERTLSPENFEDASKTKRFIQSNAILVGKLISVKCIDTNIARNLVNHAKDNHQYEIMCLILKHCTLNPELVKEYMPYLNKLGYNRDIESKIRFLAIGLLDIYDEDGSESEEVEVE